MSHIGFYEWYLVLSYNIYIFYFLIPPFKDVVCKTVLDKLNDSGYGRGTDVKLWEKMVSGSYRQTVCFTGLKDKAIKQ